MGARAPVGPGVAGVERAGTAPVAVAAADGRSGDAAGGAPTRSAAGRVEGAAHGAPTGLSGGVAGDGSISAEGDVVLRVPVVDGGADGGEPGVRRPAGGGDADDGRRGRNCGAGTGTAGPPARGCTPPKKRARPPRVPGGPHLGPEVPRPNVAAGDSQPRATRRLQRVARGAVTPPRLQ